jgi:tetratricopeptide (TPR) repeat protein
VSPLACTRSRAPRFASITALALSLSLALLGAGCAKRESSRGVAGEVIDEPLMAWLSSTRALHHEADIQEDKGELPAAIATLERLLAKAPPRKSPESDEVLADTRARLGDLRSRQGDFDAAMRDVDAGLGLVPKLSYYAGHLLEVRGVIEQRRSDALLAKGDADGGSKARERAMKAYEEAIAVQDEVIRRGTTGNAAASANGGASGGSGGIEGGRP